MVISFPATRASSDLARAYGNAVYQNSTGAALSFSTTVFCPGEIQIIPQNKEQEPFGIGVDLLSVAVDDQIHMLSLMLFDRANEAFYALIGPRIPQV